LEILGGSDGKLIILVISITPFKELNYLYLFSFFLFLIFFYIIMVIINLSLNYFSRNRFSFRTYFNYLPQIKSFQKLYMISFFRFNDLSKLYNYKENKCFLKSLDFIFNPKSNTFQFLVQIKHPLIISCYFSFYVLFLLKVWI
jgi:hypothetical protein